MLSSTCQRLYTKPTAPKQSSSCSFYDILSILLVFWQLYAGIGFDEKKRSRSRILEMRLGRTSNICCMTSSRLYDQNLVRCKPGSTWCQCTRRLQRSRSLKRLLNSCPRSSPLWPNLIKTPRTVNVVTRKPNRPPKAGRALLL